MSPSTQQPTLLDLPSEILVNILRLLTTPSFVQATLTCHQLFDLAASSRETLLHHLSQIPGIKLGLEDLTVTSSSLFLILRQRASANLFGANFHADCRELRFPNGMLDGTASYLGDSTDYINLSLVLKESSLVRHYGTGCSFRDKTYPPVRGPAEVVRVVHWRSTISVLYASHLDDSESPAWTSPFSPMSPRAGPERRVSSRFHCKSTAEDEQDAQDETKYVLVHYNAYTNRRPDIFQVPTPSRRWKRFPRPLVPIHLTVHSRLKCAILWGDPTKRHSKNTSSEIILYTCDRLPPAYEEGCYSMILLYPIPPPPKSDDSDSASRAYRRVTDFLSLFRPQAIAFFQGGRKLKLYRAGSITPYGILPCTGSLRTYLPSSGYARINNETYCDLNIFKADSPFFGQHMFETGLPAVGTAGECTNVYLQLAAAVPDGRYTKPLDTVQSDLYIAQTRKTSDVDECSHVIDLDALGSTLYGTSRVVARLWGWSSSLPTNSTLTALDLVCISPRGTRIAIACWDRILIWPLHPEIFCEEWVTETRDSPNFDHVSVDGNVVTAPAANTTNDSLSVSSVNGTDSGSSSAASSHGDEGANMPISSSTRAMVQATKFYDLVRHPQFGEIVELKPIVLKLPGGGIARKMMWSSTAQDFLDEDPIVFDVDFGASGGEEGSERLPSPVLSEGQPFPAAGRDEQDGIHHSYTRTSPDSELPPESAPHSDLDKVKGDLKAIGAGLEKELRDDMARKQEDLTKPIVALVGLELDEVPEQEEANNVQDAPLQTLNPPVPGPLSPIAEETSPTLEPSPPAPPSPSPSSTSESSEPPFPTLSTLFALAETPQQQPPEGTPESHGPEIRILRSGTRLTTPTSTPRSRSRSRGRSGSPVFSLHLSARQRDRYRRVKRRRDSEDELVVLTDRGVQVWNVGVWARGRRERGMLDEGLGAEGSF